MFIGDSDTDAEFRAIDVGELLSALDVSGNDLSDSTNSQTLWDASAGHVPQSAVQQGSGSGLDSDTLDGVELSNINWSDVSLSQSDVSVSDLGGADSRLSMNGYDLYFQPDSSGGSVTGITFQSNNNSGSDQGFIEFHDDYFGDGTGEKSALVLKTENDGIASSSGPDSIVLDAVGGTLVKDGNLRIETDIKSGSGASENITIWDSSAGHIPSSSIQSSGLDADTLDGVELGNISWSDVSLSKTDVSHTDLQNVTSNDHHSRPSAGSNLSEDGSNNFNVVQGSGSGLDADTVDGFEASDLSTSKNIAQLSSSDTSMDINTTSWVTIPWNVEYTLDGGYSHDSANSPGTITFNEAGTYRVTVSLAYDSSGTRVNPGIKLNVNGTRKKTFGLSGYIRANSGHNEASNMVMRTIEVSSGDTLKVQTTEMGDGGTVTLRSEESILEIEQLSATASLAGDADTLDGLDSSQFLRSDSSDSMQGTLDFNKTGTTDTIKFSDSTGGSLSHYTLRYNSVPVRFWAGSTSSTTLYMDQSNNVGINNQSPNYSLDVSGIINVTSDLIVGGDVIDSGTTIWDTSNSHIPQSRVQQGSGSGLDADTLDGVHLSNISYSDVSMSKYTDSEARSAINSSNISPSQVDVNGISGSASTDAGTGIGAPAVYTNIVEAQNEKGGNSTYIELSGGGYHSSVGNDEIAFVTDGSVQAKTHNSGDFSIEGSFSEGAAL